MGWVPPADGLDDLTAAFAEGERAVGEAFTLVVARYGYTPLPPQVGTNPNDAVSRWVEWWLSLPDPFDSLSCELSLLDGSDGPEVWGRVAVWRYLGRGVSLDDDLWRSEDISVRSPAEAAAALRRVVAEMVRQLARLDLTAYLAAKDAEPGAAADGGGT